MELFLASRVKYADFHDSVILDDFLSRKFYSICEGHVVFELVFCVSGEET